MKDTIVGLDLAKNVFHLATINQVGKLIKRKKLKRSQVHEYFIQLEPCKVAMEACASAHYCAREVNAMGHEVELLPPQHVKAYLRGQKNDYNDALAIAESALHGTIRPVAIKCVEQQDDQAFQRIRRQLVGDKTRLINQVRGLLAEYGIVLPQSEAAFRREIPAILGDAENGLTVQFRQLLDRQHQRFLSLAEEVAWYRDQLNIQAKTDEVCCRLTGIPGFGPVVSSAVKSWIYVCNRTHSSPNSLLANGEESIYGRSKAVGRCRSSPSGPTIFYNHHRLIGAQSARLRVLTHRLV